MANFVQGISSLFGGGPRVDTSANDAAIAAQRANQEATAIGQQRQLQSQQNQTDGNLSTALRAGVGRRLLLASSGERGVSSKLG